MLNMLPQQNHSELVAVLQRQQQQQQTAQQQQRGHMNQLQVGRGCVHVLFGRTVGLASLKGMQ